MRATEQVLIRQLDNLHGNQSLFLATDILGRNQDRYVSVVDPIEFRVSEAGRQRVLREKRKNVHAGVVGRLMFAGGVELRYPIKTEIKVDTSSEDYSVNLDNPAYRKVSYNPYKFDRFVFSDDMTDAVAVNDESVILDGTGRVVVLNPQRLHQVVTDQYLARRQA